MLLIGTKTTEENKTNEHRDEGNRRLRLDRGNRQTAGGDVRSTSRALNAGQLTRRRSHHGQKVLFVRNIQDLAGGMTMAPVPLEGWEIELVGLIKPFRVVIRAEDLLEMEQVEYEMILQCSGNGRNEYPGIKGIPWNQGGVGNVRFAGVPLSAIFEKHNVTVDPQVKYITAEGHDLPMGLERPDFEHSIPAADVLERGILALRLNGGPMRLVTPGLFGAMQVKWLSRLRFETAESSNFYHATEYRVPLSSPQARRKVQIHDGEQQANLGHSPDELRVQAGVGG